MATDFVTTTTAATSALYDAAQETYLAFLGAALDSQERTVRLTRIWIDETRRSVQSSKTLLETLNGSWQAAAEAAKDLASVPVSAAGLELPLVPLPWPTRGPAEANGVPAPPRPAGAPQPTKSASRARPAGGPAA
jgi:hypothetical protein